MAKNPKDFRYGPPHTPSAPPTPPIEVKVEVKPQPKKPATKPQPVVAASGSVEKDDK